MPQKINYNVLDLAQDTPEWHLWRKGNDLPEGFRITATAASVIAGTSPFQKPETLFAELSGLIVPVNREENAFVSKILNIGKRMEPVAKKMYEEYSGDILNPTCIENKDNPWIGASLDGLDITGKTGVEIKVLQGPKSQEKALEGIVPDHYYDQIQWQLIAGEGLEYIVYCPFLYDKASDSIQMVEPTKIYPNPERQKFLLEAVASFRNKLIQGDTLYDKNIESLADIWLKTRDQIEKLSAIKKQAEDKLKEYGFDRSTVVRGVNVVVSDKASSTVQWKPYVESMMEEIKKFDEGLWHRLLGMQQDFTKTSEGRSFMFRVSTDAEKIREEFAASPQLDMAELEQILNHVINAENGIDGNW